MSEKQLKILNTIAQTIYDKKGKNILALDVKGVSSLTDYVLIAEGNVDRHVIAIAQSVMDEMKKEGERPFMVEGLETGDWVVLDYLEYMVHLFMPGLREKYRLEELFRDGKIVDLQIKT
jgi:ribosome-associated protein